MRAKVADKKGKIMTQIGVTLKIDALGRRLIPKAMREVFHIRNNGEAEVLITTDGILIRNPRYEVKRVD